MIRCVLGVERVHLFTFLELDRGYRRLASPGSASIKRWVDAKSPRGDDDDLGAMLVRSSMPKLRRRRIRAWMVVERRSGRVSGR